MPQKERERTTVHASVKAGVFQQGFELGAKEKRIAAPAIEQRLDSKTVAHERQAALSMIPDRKREHADESPGSLLQSPLFHGCQHDLGVGVASERMAHPLELRSQHPKVV